MIRGTAIATIWILLCSFVYAWFNGIQSVSLASEALTLPVASADPQLQLFGIVPCWILVTGWHLTHTPQEQLMLRHGSRSALIMRVAVSKLTLGLGFATASSIGAMLGLLATAGLLSFQATDQVYVLLTMTLSFAALATFMTAVELAFQTRRRIAVWITVALWLISCVMLLQVPDGFAISPVGASLPRVTPSIGLSAPLVAVIVLILIALALVILDRMERSRCR